MVVVVCNRLISDRANLNSENSKCGNQISSQVDLLADHGVRTMLGRYNCDRQLRISTKLLDRRPDIKIGGSTQRWYNTRLQLVAPPDDIFLGLKVILTL